MRKPYDVDISWKRSAQIVIQALLYRLLPVEVVSQSSAKKAQSYTEKAFVGSSALWFFVK